MKCTWIAGIIIPISIFVLSYTNADTKAELGDIYEAATPYRKYSPQELQEYRMPEKWRDVEFGFDKVRVADTLAGLQAGMILFQAGCSSCHDVANGGFPLDVVSFGDGGQLNEMLSEIGVDVFVDKSPVNPRTPQGGMYIKNALTGGELGTGGFNADVDPMLLSDFSPSNMIMKHGLDAQVGTGLVAHQLGDRMKALIKKHPELEQKIYDTFGKKVYIGDYVINMLIGMYEKIMLPVESDFQRWLRGEDVKIHERGLAILMEKCVSCHSGPAFGHEQISEGLGKQEDPGCYRMTKDSTDYNRFKVPGLYGLKDSPAFMHDFSQPTIYQANKMHKIEGLTPYENRQVTKFIRNNLHDPNFHRFLEVADWE